MNQTRTNTAKWNTKKECWIISVQRNGERKYFYSSKKGRTGQAEANKKADAWLNGFMIDNRTTVKELSKRFLEQQKIHVGTSRLKNIRAMFNTRINPYIGNKKISALTEHDLQSVLDKLYTEGKATGKDTGNDIRRLRCGNGNRAESGRKFRGGFPRNGESCPVR